MKARLFVAGLRAAGWVAGTWPFAFLAGMVKALTLYGDRMVENFDAQDTRTAWQKKAEDAAYKPPEAAP